MPDGWRYPERAGSGTIIGWCKRYDVSPPGEPKVRAEKGSKRGLILRWPLPPSAGSTAGDPIIIGEGVADTVAGLGLMFDVVGVPAAHLGGEYLAELLKGRHLVFLADADTAGRKSARDLAALLLPLCASVRIVEPPAPHKDLRDWVAGGSAMRADVEELIAKAEPVKPGADSIRAPKGESVRETYFHAVPLSVLGPDEPVDWVWPGYVSRGHSTLFTGLWKAGKTTMIAHLLRDVGAAVGMANGPRPVRVLVISEESAREWKRRRDDLGIGDHVHVCRRPFMVKPSRAQWEALIAWVVEQVRTAGFGLVVFDTLPGLWSVVQENDASEVIAALMPLHQITELGAALMLVNHPRKGDAGEAQASRGSGALMGWVDIIVELRRNAPEDKADRRRVLTVYSRLDEAQGESVWELRDGGYMRLGDKAGVRQTDRLSTIEEILPVGPPGMTAEEVHGHWPAEPKPGNRTIQVDLNAGHAAGRWMRGGTGRRGDGFRYWRGVGFDSRTLPPIGARNESIDTSGDGQAVREAP